MAQDMMCDALKANAAHQATEGDADGFLAGGFPWLPWPKMFAFVRVRAELGAQFRCQWRATGARLSS
jgi:hypothetical protein